MGLSNKGTVNRAKKDLAGLAPTAEIQGESVLVTLGDVQCTIRAPLGDSGCTCPAQGMCRHRTAAILWLQGQLAQDGPEAAPPPAVDLSPLLEVPIDKIRRAMGDKAFYALLFRLGRDGLPPVEESSMVQVTLPEATVKLLIPLEHSVCTCRSRDLCRHKAAALLCYQLLKGKHTLEALTAQKEDSAWDQEQVSAAAQATAELAADLLEAGLSRLAPTAPDSASRLASLCHTASLPRLERGLRILSTLLDRALRRSAAFRTEELLGRLADLYQLACRLSKASSPEQVQELAGTFRDTYLPCPDLTLHLLGERAFHADSGYAGTVYYFWETTQSRWYTYTYARPTIYDNKPRLRYIPAPWGLEGRIGSLYDLSLTLHNGKAAQSRLSSTGEAARGKACRPWEVLPSHLWWEDFAAMFDAVSPYLLEGTETDRLVLLRPAACRPQPFDQTRQLFRLLLLDEEGRCLPLEVTYREEERELIEALEKLVRDLKPNDLPAFLGLLDLTEEGLRVYPVEVYSEWRCCP